MNTDQRNLFLLRGVIASLPQPEQDQIQAIYAQLAESIKPHGDLGAIALGLLGAEHAARSANGAKP